MNTCNAAHVHWVTCVKSVTARGESVDETLVKEQLLSPMQQQCGVRKDGSQSKIKGKEYQIFFHYKMYLVPDPGTTEVTRNVQLARAQFHSRGMSAALEAFGQTWNNLERSVTNISTVWGERKHWAPGFPRAIRKFISSIGIRKSESFVYQTIILFISAF